MDELRATSALSALHGSDNRALLNGKALQMAELVDQGLVRLQGPGADETFCASVKEAIGLPLPQKPCTLTSTDTLRCLWLNPTEWLLITGQAEESGLIEQFETCTGDHTALVTLNTDSRCGIRIEGEMVEQLLSKGCTLDFHLSAFPVGKCTVARFNSLPVILVRGAESRFDFYIDRTLVEHAWHWLADAAVEFNE
jgi:sarcosine oxidase subunit gamma